MAQTQWSSWPVVVGGCHRSGTSLLRRILNSHSRIHCGPEVKFFPELYSRSDDPWRMLRFLWTARSLVPEDELLEVVGQSLLELHNRAARAAGKVRWADKAPENVLYWPQWQRLLGREWLFVNVVRNPLDTIASIAEAQFVDLPTTLDAQIDHYRTYVEAGLRLRSESPERYRIVVYEQLVDHPSSTLVELMASLGEQFEAQQLRFNELPHQPGLEDPKVAGTTGVHRGSVNRWPSLLSEDDAGAIWSRTGDLWGHFDPEGRFVDPVNVVARL